jgi:carbonic anhydrase
MGFFLKNSSIQQPSRRKVLKQTLALSALTVTGVAGLSIPTISFAASLTKEERDRMTPDTVIEHFKQGNLRFQENRPARHDYLAQKRSSASGQFPAAVILGCIDSRAPAEIVLDAGIGETFNSRIAGNISNDDILGSMEFACAVAGAKLVLVMGHTACGAVKGAIDNAELGHLTGLLDKIKPAIEKTEYSGERTANNYNFVDAVAKKNVELTIESIRNSSPVLKELEDENKIKIVGSMYHLTDGRVDFFEV